LPCLDIVIYRRERRERERERERVGEREGGGFKVWVREEYM
jgi:hypothetical protein